MVEIGLALQIEDSQLHLLVNTVDRPEQRIGKHAVALAVIGAVPPCRASPGRTSAGVVVDGAEHRGARADVQSIVGRVVLPVEGAVAQLIAGGFGTDGEVFVVGAGVRGPAVVHGQDVVVVLCLADDLVQSVEADEEVRQVSDGAGVGSNAAFGFLPALVEPEVRGRGDSAEGVGYAIADKGACHLQQKMETVQVT